MIRRWGHRSGLGRARPGTKRVLVSVLLGFGLLLYAAARMEAAVDSATLSGTVVLEQDGSPLPGVTVTATDEPRGVPYTAVTDAINLHARGIHSGLKILAPGEKWHGRVMLRFVADAR